MKFDDYYCCILTTIIIMISITTVLQIHIQIQSNTKHRWTQIHSRLRCSGTNSFINFWLWFFDTRRETILKSLSFHTMLTTPQRSAHLVVQSQFLNTMVGIQLNLFKNLPNSQPISSGHDVIHTPTPFPVWGLSWQWWLSYPLYASVNCTNWLHTWTLHPNSSKPNQTEW